MSHHLEIKGRVIGAAALLALLSGCTAAPSRDEWTTPTVSDDFTFIEGQSLPFDAFHLSEPELQRMQAKQAQLLTACAAKYGATVTFGGDYIRPTDDSRSMWGGRFGTMSAEHASTLGYHAGPDDPWAPVGGFYLPTASNVQPNQSADEALAQVVTGGAQPDGSGPAPIDATGEPLPPGGCYAVVEAEIGAELHTELGILSDLFGLTLNDPRVKEAMADWSSCMGAAGYDFTDIQGPVEKFNLSMLSPEETEVAIADVKCTRSSNWSNLFYEILTSYQQQALAKQRGDMPEVLASEKFRLERLDSLVSD
jgi:hypothetical protein